MFRKYSFEDYENAYCSLQCDKCKEIGLYLLQFIDDKRARKLEKELSKIEYKWDLPKEELDHITEILSEVKVCIMVNKC